MNDNEEPLGAMKNNIAPHWTILKRLSCVIVKSCDQSLGNQDVVPNVAPDLVHVGFYCHIIS